MSVFGVSWGTVESGKAEMVYMSSILSKRYNVNYILVRPTVISNIKEIRFKNKKVYYENSYYPHEVFYKVRKDERYVIHVQHFHLIEQYELKQIIKYFKYKDVMINFLGLKFDYEANVYEQFEFLIKEANISEELESYCSVCGRRAKYNQAVYDDEPLPIIPSKQTLIYLNYEPRCEDCYIHPKEVSKEILERPDLFFSLKQS